MIFETLWHPFTVVIKLTDTGLSRNFNLKEVDTLNVDLLSAEERLIIQPIRDLVTVAKKLYGVIMKSNTGDGYLELMVGFDNSANADDFMRKYNMIASGL